LENNIPEQYIVLLCGLVAQGEEEFLLSSHCQEKAAIELFADCCPIGQKQPSLETQHTHSSHTQHQQGDWQSKN